MPRVVAAPRAVRAPIAVRRPTGISHPPQTTVAINRIVVTTKLDSYVERARVIVWVGVKSQARLLPGSNDCLTNTVLNEVVVEVGPRGQAQNEISDLRFGVFNDVPDISHTVVPVVATNKLLELERITGEGCVDGSNTLRGIHAEGLSIAAPSDLEFVPASHEVVVNGVDREKYAHTAIRLGVQHEQVSIRFCTDIDLHTVTQLNTIPV